MFVASGAFVDAAQAQGNALGFQPERVFVEHPIQDRTDEEIAEIADRAVESLVSKLTGAD